MVSPILHEFKSQRKVTIPRYLYKYCSINHNTLKSIEDGYLWFSSLTDFNDPFEGFRTFSMDVTDEEFLSYHLATRTTQFLIAKSMHEDGLSVDEAIERYAKKILPYKEKLLSRWMSDFFGRMNTNVGLCCLSEVPDHRLMWAHYADNFRGVCLVFNLRKLVDPTKMSCIKVRYLKRIPKYNYVRKRVADLKKNNGRMSPDFNVKCDQEMFGTKHHDWSYEKEQRLFSYHQGAVQFDPSSLVGVIFGTHTTDSDLAKVVVAAMNSRSSPKYSNIYLDQQRKSVELCDFRNEYETVLPAGAFNLAEVGRQGDYFKGFRRRTQLMEKPPIDLDE